MAQISQRLKSIIDANVPEHLRPYMYRMVGKEGASGRDSPTGAAGPLQFTEGTGRAYGLIGKQGDIRRDPVANIQAGVKLTNDNAAILQRYIGRAPTHSELALAHQQGADTAGRMLTGRGNASPKNLAVNNVDPNLPPQAAAEKIMNYYGFDNKQMVPGLSLTGGFNPNQPGAFAAPDTAAPGAIPSLAGFVPPPGGTTLTSAPADMAVASGAAPASFADRMLGGANATGEAAKSTPFARTFEGLGDLAKGIKGPAADPRLNDIAPMSGGAAQQQAVQAPLAQGMLTQMIQAMQARRGIK